MVVLLLLLDAEVEVVATVELDAEANAEARGEEEVICCKLLLGFWTTSGGLAVCWTRGCSTVWWRVRFGVVARAVLSGLGRTGGGNGRESC